MWPRGGGASVRNSVSGILELGGKLNRTSHQYSQHHYNIITCLLSFLLANCTVPQRTQQGQVPYYSLLELNIFPLWLLNKANFPREAIRMREWNDSSERKQISGVQSSRNMFPYKSEFSGYLCLTCPENHGNGYVCETFIPAPYQGGGIYVYYLSYQLKIWVRNKPYTEILAKRRRNTFFNLLGEQWRATVKVLIIALTITHLLSES